MKITPLLLLPFAALLLALPLSAQDSAVPDFSKGMPDAKLERKMKIQGQEAYRLKTTLGSKEFSTTLVKFLGAGWHKRALTADESFSLTAARTYVAECSLEMYKNEKFPGIEVRASYSREKKGDAEAHVDIQAFKSK